MILTRYPAHRPPVWANDPIEEEPIMTTAHSTLIRAGAGNVRVLRLSTIGRVLIMLAYDVPKDTDRCHYCGCTDLFGCTPQCYWVDLARWKAKLKEESL
jgi:hypothetical protein